MIHFPLLQKEETFELRYGLYALYLSGGFSIDNLDLLDIHLFNAVTKDTITLKEKSLKPRDFIRNERAICCYEFQIKEFGTYKIEIANPEVLIIKSKYDNPFSVLKFIFPNPPIDAKYVNVFIK